MSPFVHLMVRNPKDDETPIESATQIFASLLPYPYIPWWKWMVRRPHLYAFEIVLADQTISFYVTTREGSATFVTSLIASSYPHSSVVKANDPLQAVFRFPRIAVGQVALRSYFFLPIKTYFDFKDIDPLSSLVGFLSKQDQDLAMAVQIVVTPASFPWQDKTVKQAGHLLLDTQATTPANPVTGKSSIGHYTRDPQQLLMMQKASFQGGKALVRLVVGTKTVDPRPLLNNLAGTFGSFSHGDGNQFVFKRPIIFRKRFIERIKKRTTTFFERRYQILNAQELGSIWHPPGLLLAGIRNISWGKTLSGEPPENLPVAPSAGKAVDAQALAAKQDVNFFAQADFKNTPTIFGIKTQDRRKHVYIIGKTGAGKSTLIANMAIDDIRKGRGVGIIDPHGDLSEVILDFIPNRRVNDVVYLEPFNPERAFALNVLEVKHAQQKDLVASGIVAIFYKLYKDSWGPRLEYILRNVIFTLLEVPGATLADVLPLLSDAQARKRMVEKVSDPVIKAFWEKEFARMPEQLRQEAISPIQNKVGQFVSSRMIRNIIGHPTSTVDLEDIMNEGKILILNLSQGKLGEDNAALLGAMIITQLQLAAMNRSFMKEEERRDFFLFVDEFQNFATASFIKILSEARKYRLSLTLANQYIGQLDETVQKAIFGNVGTLIAFVVGGADAFHLVREFAEVYTENDLVSLGKYETVLKLSIDGMTSMPFPAKTLPLPSVRNENREKIIKVSRERYTRNVSVQ